MPVLGNGFKWDFRVPEEEIMAEKKNPAPAPAVKVELKRVTAPEETLAEKEAGEKAEKAKSATDAGLSDDRPVIGKQCTYCKKYGHDEAHCHQKERDAAGNNAGGPPRRDPPDRRPDTRDTAAAPRTEREETHHGSIPRTEREHPVDEVGRVKVVDGRFFGQTTDPRFVAGMDHQSGRIVTMPTREVFDAETARLRAEMEILREQAFINRCADDSTRVVKVVDLGPLLRIPEPATPVEDPKPTVIEIVRRGQDGRIESGFIKRVRVGADALKSAEEVGELVPGITTNEVGEMRKIREAEAKAIENKAEKDVERARKDGARPWWVGVLLVGGTILALLTGAWLANHGCGVCPAPTPPCACTVCPCPAPLPPPPPPPPAGCEVSKDHTPTGQAYTVLTCNGKTELIWDGLNGAPGETKVITKVITPPAPPPAVPATAPQGPNCINDAHTGE